MTVEISNILKQYSVNCESLKLLLTETIGALQEVHPTLEVGRGLQGLFNQETIESLLLKLNKSVILLVYGDNCHAKALCINNLFGQSILPLHCSRWRPIHFKYGQIKNIRLIWENEFEIVEPLNAHRFSWTTIPNEDLLRTECPTIQSPSIEVDLCHPLLKENLKISVAPDCQIEEMENMFKINLANVLPVIIYAVANETLDDFQIQQIRLLKEMYKSPILFVSFNDILPSISEADHLLVNKEDEPLTIFRLQSQLLLCGYLDQGNRRTEELIKRKAYCYDCSIYNTLTYLPKLFVDLTEYFKDVLKCNLLHVAAKLNKVHNKCLRKFILCAFDMAREIQITPRRINYAQEIEMRLYRTLMNISNEQQEELTGIIQRILHEMKLNVHSLFEGMNQNQENISDPCSSSTERNTIHEHNTRRATIKLQELVLNRLRITVANELAKSIGCLHESFTGTLQRCLENLEKNCHENEGNLSASDAVKQILSAAYNIDIKSSTSFSAIHTFVDRLKKVLLNFVSPWPTPPPGISVTSIHWQTQVAITIVESLRASKLAKTISKQFQDHVSLSHVAFQLAIRSLERQLFGQLEQTEEQRISIRKRHAPRFARLALESTSFCDLLVWGMPQQIREIGRGQYGVVSSCEPWGEINPCAFKSVVPPDDRHWNDLAMEFYYTRTIPEHPRIVKLRGSVIDYTYGGGSSPAVLLVMERMARDLHSGLRTGLPWPTRLQIAIDVVEGIRYLHSQGLVHRDIKLKNVLLDAENRAKLTDFGFCIPEAMMSGSVVGTPVHMAPELLSGRYDSSVDVYAFGILFWYICAGQVKLPNHFDQFQNKEQLWNNVRKGIRPECLQHFDEACWNLMEQCWAAEPADRPLLGYVQPQLEAIFANAVANEEASAKVSSDN